MMLFRHDFIIFIIILVTNIGISMAIHYFLNYILDFLCQSSSGSANAQLPGCLGPWTLSLYLGFQTCCLYVMFTFPTRIFTGEFQALQLIVLAAFGAVD